MGTVLKITVPPQFDEDGFLADPKQWDQDVAEQIAREDGFGQLSDAHWAVILEMREHYLEHGSLVPESHACRSQNLDPQCVTSLFRSMREAWRIAGLPNPGEEAKSYM